MKYLQKTATLHPGKWDHTEKLLRGGIQEEGEPRFHHWATGKHLLLRGTAY